MLVCGHGLGLMLLDQLEMEVLFPVLIGLAVAVLVQLHLLVQFLRVCLGHVVHHHRDVLRIELTLNA